MSRISITSICERASQGLVKDPPTFKNFSTTGIHYFPAMASSVELVREPTLKKPFIYGPFLSVCVDEIEKFLKVGESLTKPLLALCFTCLDK